MGWAEKRIQQFKKGKKPTWWERRFIEQADPITFALTIFGGFFLVVGIWSHDVPWMTTGVAVMAIGHIFAWLS
ncbi:MAG TPA: hypothetical protein VFQ60_05300 [Patescibacteria group bacterium]|nr:hypothetical protein [Patescibacteria group bacterium]